MNEIIPRLLKARGRASDSCIVPVRNSLRNGGRAMDDGAMLQSCSPAVLQSCNLAPGRPGSPCFVCFGLVECNLWSPMREATMKW